MPDPDAHPIATIGTGRFHTTRAGRTTGSIKGQRCHVAATVQEVIFYYTCLTTSTRAGAPAPPPDDPLARDQLEVLRTTDPATQTVPPERLEQARREVQQRIRTNDFASALSPTATWTERGPNNIGGRTRMVMFDPNDPAKKKVWAGGVAGGLWYNNDITDPNQSWQKINDFWENLAITSMVYDPNNPNVMYVSTGEAFGADGLIGGGIWKTTNGGQTWNRLINTIPANVGDISALSNAFSKIFRLVVDLSGRVYAATIGGLLKSTGGGVT